MIRGLFGEDLPDQPAPPKGKRMDLAHIAPVGSGPAGETCGSCIHRTHRGGVAGRYQKCQLTRFRWTGGPGTDIRAKDLACAKWEKKSEGKP